MRMFHSAIRAGRRHVSHALTHDLQQVRDEILEVIRVQAHYVFLYLRTGCGGGGRERRAGGRGHLLRRPRGVPGERPPIWTSGQRDVQVVVREEAAVAVGEPGPTVCMV